MIWIAKIRDVDRKIKYVVVNCYVSTARPQDNTNNVPSPK